SPRHTPGGAYEISCSRTAAMANRAQSVSGCRLDGRPCRAGRGIVVAPIDISAHVHEGLLPGETALDDTNSVRGAPPTPQPRAKCLCLASKRENLSGRFVVLGGRRTLGLRMG